jgi:N-acyl-D-aspartate/D-glutamate deacylase
MAEYDIIIKGGTIVDGLRTPRYIGDLAIKDGKIAKIGGLRSASADKVLDASGSIVAPGIIDLHTHYDAQIFWDPYLTMSGWHGVTSVAIGNCGFGFAPCRDEDRERAMLALTRNEAIPLKAMQFGMPWDWVTFPEFLDSLDRTPKGVNLLSYVPLTPLYGWVMGWDEAKKRRPTDAELQEMRRLLHEGLDAGGCGWSAQVLGPDSLQRDYDGTPMITDLMSDDELLAFAQVLGERDEGFIELTYRESGNTREIGKPTIELFERVAEISGRPVLYQTVSADTTDSRAHRDRLDWLEECVGRGLRLYGQGVTFRGGFEFTFADWNLYDDVPTWREVTLGSVEERLHKMQDPELRRTLREEWDAGIRPSPGATVDPIDRLVVVEVGHQELGQYEGLTVGQIASQQGKHVIDALIDLAVSDGLQTEFLANRSESPGYTAEMVRSPYVIPGLSDGGAHVKFQTSGGFGTDLLIWLVRDEGLVSLEEAHYKLSYLPAFFGGFRDRGCLRVGAPADVLVYDMEKLDVLPSEVMHDLPGDEWRRVVRAVGYQWIMVNGQVTFEGGTATGAHPGKLVRHGVG